MARSTALRYGFSWTFAGVSVYAACQWGMLQVLACHATPAIVGQFTLGLALVTPLTAFVDRTLRSLQASADRAEARGVTDYLEFRVLAGLASLAVIGGIVLVRGYPRQTAIVIGCVAFLKLVEGLSNVFYGRMHQREQMDLIARSLIVRGLLSLIVFAVSFHVSGQLALSVISVIAVNSVILLFLGATHGNIAAVAGTFGSSHVGAKRRQDGRSTDTKIEPSRSRRETLANIFWQGLPLGVASFLVALNSSIPRFTLERHYGEAMLGVFSVMFFLALPLTMVVGAMTQTAIPRLAEWHRHGRERPSWLLLGKNVVTERRDGRDLCSRHFCVGRAHSASSLWRRLRQPCFAVGLGNTCDSVR